MVRFMIFLTTLLYGSSVINVSYFPNDKKVDILFSLDEPFKGKISKIEDNHYKIGGVFINRIEQKKINNLNILISPLSKDEIELKLLYKTPLSIKAAITAKGYGLRLRVLGIKTKKMEYQPLSSKDVDSFNVVNYFIVISILVLLIVVLFIIKKRAISKLPASLQKDGYKLLYQKMIDPKNRLVLIEVFGKRYLLLLGEKNNVLLDNFPKQDEELKDISSSKFENLLDEKLQDDYIQKASRLKDLENV